MQYIREIYGRAEHELGIIPNYGIERLMAESLYMAERLYYGTGKKRHHPQYSPQIFPV